MFTKYSHLTTDELYRMALHHEQIPHEMAHELLLRLEWCMDELDLWEDAFGERGYVEGDVVVHDA